MSMVGTAHGVGEKGRVRCMKAMNVNGREVRKETREVD